MEERVILVDWDNNELGTMEKLEAHQKWVLHRAFSVFLFNDAGELLIQKRAIGKYHCGGFWTNTVCSHQRVWEENLDAAVRRLKEEMWIIFTRQELEVIWSEVYHADFSNGLIEHEYDFVIVGKYNGEVVISPEEVMDYKWISLEDLKIEIEKNRKQFTPWFKLLIRKDYFWDRSKNLEL